MTRRRHALSGVVIAIAFVGALAALWRGGLSDRDDAVVTVFAAASLADALEKIGAVYVADGGDAVRFSFAASSTLARQIEAGAAADLFFSAHAAWMDRLEAAGQLAPGRRRDALRNRLVVIGSSARADVDPHIDPRRLPAHLAAGERLAIGDSAHVPAGLYAVQALRSLGVFEPLASRLATTDNVRAALALVARGEAPYGLVYASDIAVARGVREVAAIEASLHEPIVYPLAVLAGRDREPVRAFYAFLAGDTARAIFLELGFEPL